MINLFFLLTYNKRLKTPETIPTWRIHHVSRVHMMQWTHMKTIHKKRPRQTHTSIGPSDWSEEAHPSMTIDGHQTGSDTRERAVKVPLHLHRNPGPHGINSQMLPPWEQSRTLTQGTHDAPRNEQEHIPHTGEFHPSLHRSNFWICWCIDKRQTSSIQSNKEKRLSKS